MTGDSGLLHAQVGIKDWVAVKELNLSYHIAETLLITIYTLNLSSLRATQKMAAPLKI